MKTGFFGLLWAAFCLLTAIIAVAVLAPAGDMKSGVATLLGVLLGNTLHRIQHG